MGRRIWVVSDPPRDAHARRRPMAGWARVLRRLRHVGLGPRRVWGSPAGVGFVVGSRPASPTPPWPRLAQDPRTEGAGSEAVVGRLRVGARACGARARVRRPSSGRRVALEAPSFMDSFTAADAGTRSGRHLAAAAGQESVVRCDPPLAPLCGPIRAASSLLSTSSRAGGPMWSFFSLGSSVAHPWRRSGGGDTRHEGGGGGTWRFEASRPRLN